jgi:two-component system sensor histidine kinase TctE
MQRLENLLENQKRFVRDAAHQIRTPLAVLKLQVQSARRGDMAPNLALQDIEATVDRATQLANQMLSLAKIEQLRQQKDYQWLDWAPSVREIALDLSPLIAAKSLDFEIETQACTVLAHAWILREMTRNLLDNAIRHCPAGARLRIDLQQKGSYAVLLISDSGSGMDAAQGTRLFQAFATERPASGSGLGLTIAREMVLALGGEISLENRYEATALVGLDATIGLPMKTSKK